jgi:DNA-binding transcriptional MerR regulator
MSQQTPTPQTFLDRRRDAARKLGVSESQVLKWEREGFLTPVRIPGIRAVRYASAQVDDLAKRWIASSVSAPTIAARANHEDHAGSVA